MVPPPREQQQQQAVRGISSTTDRRSTLPTPVCRSAAEPAHNCPPRTQAQAPLGGQPAAAVAPGLLKQQLYPAPRSSAPPSPKLTVTSEALAKRAASPSRVAPLPGRLVSGAQRGCWKLYSRILIAHQSSLAGVMTCRVCQQLRQQQEPSRSCQTRFRSHPSSRACCC
jgi:hypothetical protein